jgi:hypothetical protein
LDGIIKNLYIICQAGELTFFLRSFYHPNDWREQRNNDGEKAREDEKRSPGQQAASGKKASPNSDRISSVSHDLFNGNLGLVMPRFHFESINKTSNSDANLYRNYPKYQ